MKKVEMLKLKDKKKYTYQIFLRRLFNQAIHSFVNIFYIFKCTNYYNYISRKQNYWTWQVQFPSCWHWIFNFVMLVGLQQTQSSQCTCTRSRVSRVRSVVSMFRDERQFALIVCYFWWWNKFTNWLQW